MEQTLTIQKLTPWSDYNDYEGEIEGVFHQQQICCYVFMASGEDWQTYAPNDQITIDLWLERSGTITLVDFSIGAELCQISGSNYEVTGTIQSIAAEEIWLNSVFSMRIDLDLTPAVESLITNLAVGDQIRIVGILKAEIE
jgi:hypothetical protein